LLSADNGGTKSCQSGCSSFTGYVYCDNNNDGSRQSGECGIGGVWVTLTGKDSSGQTVSMTRMTDANGCYIFDNLKSSGTGGYTIKETQPTCFTDGMDKAGSRGGTLSNDTISAITLPSSTNAIDYIFGELGASLGDKVWNDANKNGVQDSGEAGLAGITVKLTGAGADAIFGTLDDTAAQTTTNSSGVYSFSGLAAGKYTVNFTANNGWLLSPANVGSNDNVDSDADAITGTTAVYTLTNNQSNLTVDAGMYRQIATGLTQSASFWNGATGQDLINSFGNTSGGKSLANYLATTYSALYGTSAGSMNLTNKTNAQVAALFQSLYADPSRQADAQLMATALSVFATTNSLNTNSTARTKATNAGFVLSTNGAGAASYNVGAFGAAFGLTNNTSTTISDLLARANARAVSGAINGGNASLATQTYMVFWGING
jgi:hypothetical protein